jgi:hypothetical protein
LRHFHDTALADNHIHEAGIYLKSFSLSTGGEHTHLRARKRLFGVTIKTGERIIFREY